METLSESDGLSLLIKVPSPTGDADRTLYIWVDEAVTASIGFGPSHTHEEPADRGFAAILILARAVLEDRIVIAVDNGGQYDGHADWLDLRDPLALASLLTSPWSPGLLRLKSFSGTSDQSVSLQDVVI